MMKRFFVLILGMILSTGVIGEIGLVNNNVKENKVSISSENVTEEIQNNEETINVVLENNEEQEELSEEMKEDINEEIATEENRKEVIPNKQQTVTPIVNSSYNQSSNTSAKTTSTTNNTSQSKTETQTTTKPEPVKAEQPRVEEQKKEENKPVESKPIETPKPTAPVREFKANQNYINKLRSTITTEVTNNLEQLNKYGITDVNQYQIIVDSSICTCYGGNRNGWTYENVSAYNTFKSSILKGTNLKIYAVDEYYNGEYIQTLCYYGH